MTTLSAPPRVNVARIAGVSREYGVVVALIALVMIFSLTTDGFLTLENLRNIAQQSAGPALIACGMTVVIVVGEFDLSAGATLGFSGIVFAMSANTWGVFLAILVAILLGAGLGLVNGLIVTTTGIESFLVTLATQFVFLGVAIYVTGGAVTWSVEDPAAIEQLARTTVAGVEMRAWVALIAFVITWIVLRRTRAGKQIFAVGGNLDAARVAGVRVHAVRVGVFVFSGALAAIAGILATAETGAARASGGIGLEFVAITAVIVGGTSIAGGRGSVWRTLIGVLLLAVIANGFTLLWIDPTYNLLVQGTVILAAVGLDARLKRKYSA